MADAVVGQQLRSFFLELLTDTKLNEYYQGRDAFIDRRVLNPETDRVILEPEDEGVVPPYLGTEAQRLLRSRDLRDIEANIMEVTGSGSAVPIWVVSPPMGLPT